MPHPLALSDKSLNSQCDRQILCFYANTTSRVQTIRLIKCPDLPWQRLAFPGQRLMFEALAEDNLEIQSQENVTSIIPCSQLQVTEL